jgi:hypothetical protein
MKKIHEYLVELNALRASLNKMQLKDWKSSTEEIKNEILRMKKKINEFDLNAGKKPSQKLIIETDKPTPEAKAVTVKQIVADTVKKTTPAPTETVTAPKTKTYSFRDMNPKVARAKLRKAFGKGWQNKTAEEITAVLFPKKD